MKLDEIRHNLWKGNLLEVIDAVDDDIYSQGYKVLALCLKGDLTDAKSIMNSIEIDNLNLQHKFVMIVLKTCIVAYEGREQDLHQLFSQGEKLLEQMSELEHKQIEEWEGWLNYGLGTFYVLNLLYHKPNEYYLRRAIEIFTRLPWSGASEWPLLLLVVFYGNTNNQEELNKCIEQMELITSDKGKISKSIHQLALIPCQYLQGEKDFKEIISSLLTQFAEYQIRYPKVFLYRWIALITHYEGKFDEAIIQYQEAVKLGIDTGIHSSAARELMALAYIDKGNPEGAIKCLEEKLILTSSLGNLTDKYFTMINLALHQRNLGNYKVANEHLEACMVGFKDIKDSIGEATTFYNKGQLLRQRLQIDEAIVHYIQALRLFVKGGSKVTYGGPNSLPGRIRAGLADRYSFKGEFDKALKLIDTSLDKTVESQGIFTNLINLKNIRGSILFQMGDYSRAEEEYKDSLAKIREIRGKEFTGYILYMLSLISNKLGNTDDAKEYFKQLQELDQHSDDDSIHHYTWMAEAVINKSNPRAINKVRAQQLFKQVIDETLDMEMKKFAMINLLDTLLWELSSSGHNEIIIEIQSILDELGDIAEKEGSIILLIDVAMIQSQIHLIEGNANEAMDLLKRSLDIAKNYNLTNHIVRVQELQNQVNDELSKWIELNQQNASLIDRLEQSNVKDYVDMVLTMMDKGSEKTMESTR